jgi:hypothetical protein
VDNLLSLQGELGLQGTGSVEYLRKVRVWVVNLECGW